MAECWVPASCAFRALGGVVSDHAPQCRDLWLWQGSTSPVPPLEVKSAVLVSFAHQDDVEGWRMGGIGVNHLWFSLACSAYHDLCPERESGLMQENPCLLY